MLQSQLVRQAPQSEVAMNGRRTDPELGSLASGLISLLFWSGLGLSALIMATLVLSPRWLQSEHLRLRFVENDRMLAELKRETDHLTQVAYALKNDKEYLARVAASEFNAIPVGGKHIPMDSSLEYDSRTLLSDEHPAPPITPGIQAWYEPYLELAATSVSIRWRLMSAAVLLLLLTFFCFHEAFFRGGLQNMLFAGSASFGHRYRIPTKSD